MHDAAANGSHLHARDPSVRGNGVDDTRKRSDEDLAGLEGGADEPDGEGTGETSLTDDGRDLRTQPTGEAARLRSS